VSAAADTPPTRSVLDGLDSIMKPLENLYRDLHAHPELAASIFLDIFNVFLLLLQLFGGGRD
jgi:hypothetical protein